MDDGYWLIDDGYWMMDDGNPASWLSSPGNDPGSDVLDKTRNGPIGISGRK